VIVDCSKKTMSHIDTYQDMGDQPSEREYDFRTFLIHLVDSVIRISLTASCKKS